MRRYGSTPFGLSMLFLLLSFSESVISLSYKNLQISTFAWRVNVALACAKILSIPHEGLLLNTSPSEWFHVETIIQYARGSSLVFPDSGLVSFARWCWAHLHIRGVLCAWLLRLLCSRRILSVPPSIYSHHRSSSLRPSSLHAEEQMASLPGGF